jgi:hypothetical protein
MDWGRVCVVGWLVGWLFGWLSGYTDAKNEQHADLIQQSRPNTEVESMHVQEKGEGMYPDTELVKTTQPGSRFCNSDAVAVGGHVCGLDECQNVR